MASVLRRDLELYLVRHGVAAERGEAWPDDSKRPLTNDGITRMRRAARGLAAFGVQFDVILTSPLVRTRQTADILAAACTPTPPIVLMEALAPGGSPAGVLAELGKHTRKERIALVGHEPGIGELAALLLGTQRPIAFRKGAVARIDVPVPGTDASRAHPSDALTGTLRWLLPPRALRALRK